MTEIPIDDGFWEAADERTLRAMRPHFASRMRVRFVSRNADGTLVVAGGDLGAGPQRIVAQTRPAYVPSANEWLYGISQGGTLLVVSP